MYPTLCELCGLPVPAHCEGLSFVPLLEDADRAWKRAAFSQYPRRGGEVMGTTMRTDRFRYTIWEDAATGEVLARELYDHAEDPHENVNAALSPVYADVVARLEAQLRRGWEGARPAAPAPA
jgi:arylsulfatase A-like enzyme